MLSDSFNYIIIGAGAAGLNLAWSIYQQEALSKKTVLIIDSPEKRQKKTWCFWEKGAGRFDEIVEHHWDLASFTTKSIQKNLELAPYRYKLVPSENVWSYVKNKLPSDRFIWTEELVLDVTPELEVNTGSHTYSADFVFDSRVLEEVDASYPGVLQHFKGWFVRFDQDVLDPNSFDMMDYQHYSNDRTQFMYVLPFNSREALLEYTCFDNDLVEDEKYDRLIHKYIEARFNTKFTVYSTEAGVIPMTTFPFGTMSVHPNHFFIGTAGGWVKPSSGYSFRNCMEYADELALCLAQNRRPKIQKPRRFHHYDTWFLDVLDRKNDSGPLLFESMYSRNSIQTIFRFLDEETTFTEELKVMSTFPSFPFMKSIWRKISGRIK